MSNRSFVAVCTVLCVVVFSLVALRPAVGQTLIGSPFITSWDGWIDTYDYSSPPQRGGLPGWGILIDNETLCQTSDGAPGLGGQFTDPPGTGGDSQYHPFIMVNSRVTPSQYTITATLSTYDDDGLGIVFGYQDNDNYFRIGIREQGGTNTYGFPQGLSFEKIVNGVITQVAGPDALRVPPSSIIGAVDNTPFPLRVEVNGSAVNVYGPDQFGLPLGLFYSGSVSELATLGAGRYGVMSWCQQEDTNSVPHWGTQLHSMTIDENSNGMIDKTHTFTGAWPLDMKTMRMTNALGAYALNESGIEGEGCFKLAFSHRGDPNDGVIIENSNAYQWATESGPNADFISPAIIVGQAGAMNMEDYQMQVRLQADDNEGPGVLFRVQQDETDPTQVSFYRVNFALQAMGTGVTRPPQGMSIQKCVAQPSAPPIWTELFREDEDPGRFLYKDFTDNTPSIPFDLKVIVTNNEDDTAATIRVEVINDPDGAATKYTWEVIDDDNPLLTGTVGFANWGGEQFSSDGFVPRANSYGTVFSGYGGDVNAPLVIVPSTIPRIPGDANGDGTVDDDDAKTLAANWGQSGGWTQGDFNDDGVIDALDAAIMAGNWGYVWAGAGEATAVPEPGVFALLLGAAVAMAAIRRRK